MKVAANLLGGMTYRQMASALGVSLGTICNDVKIIIGRWRKEQTAVADKAQQVDLQRIARAMNAIWERVVKGDDKAINTMVKLMERRAKLLGMDAPTRADITTDGDIIRILVGGIDLADGV